MAKSAVEDWDTTAANNLDLAGTISLAEGVMPADKVNDAMREMMAQIKADAIQRVKSAGFRNKLINPLGTVNQRAYVSGAATSGANQYTVDRWYVITSGQSLSWTESEGVRTFTAPAGGAGQKIEGSSILSGTYTISWTGTATCTVDGVAKSSGDTVTLTGGTNCTVIFSGGTFSKPQLEPGAYATEFEQRPIGLEEFLCARFYCEIYHATNTESASRTSIATSPYLAKMRATPTVLSASVIFSSNVGSLLVQAQSATAFRTVLGASASGAAEYVATLKFSAEL